VLDPLAGYLRLAERLWDEPALASAYNFGPRSDEAAMVGSVVELAREAYGRGETQHSDGPEGPHEAGWLSLDVALARLTLGVGARWPLAEAVRRTMQWYRRQADGADARALCEADIADHEAAA
jgi:CDP-glucose 4,6-dehydratase